MAILRLTTEGPNQRARLAVVCTGEPVEITLGHARPKACVLLSISKKKKRRMSCFLPGPVVPSRLLTFVEHQIRETYGLTLDSAFCPVSSANTTLKVPLLVSLFHVTMSTK